MRAWGVVALAALVSACSGGVVPRSVEPGPRPAERAAPIAERPAEPHAHVAVRQPIPATPIAPYFAPAPAAGVTSAAKAGVIAGPAVDTLPISDAGAERALTAFRLSCNT
ncbi:MAG: hypothetical protein EOP59_18335, partial [Sphingomonadales bacterium]